MSSASSSSSSALIAKPNLIKLRIRFAKTVGSSNEKPEVNKLVSYNNQTKSLTVLSDLSTSAFSLNDLMIGCPGLTSNVFLNFNVFIFGFVQTTTPSSIICIGCNTCTFFSSIIDFESHSTDGGTQAIISFH